MPERLVSTTCLGNLNDPSYELLLRRELGGKWAAGVVVLQCAIAWLCSLVVYFLGSLL